MGLVLTLVTLALTLTTAYIHSTLGGLLFTLNAIGYAGLAALIGVGALAPMPIVRRFRWFPIVALAGHAAVTIGGYLVIGPYFALGWVTKGVEVVLLLVLALGVRRSYGGVGRLVAEARESTEWLVRVLRGHASELPSAPPSGARIEP
jgi:hypothetical protein